MYAFAVTGASIRATSAVPAIVEDGFECIRGDGEEVCERDVEGRIQSRSIAN